MGVVTETIVDAEVLFGKGQGPKKKEHVMEFSGDILDATNLALTAKGKKPLPKEEAMKAIDNGVDAVVGAVNVIDQVSK